GGSVGGWIAPGEGEMQGLQPGEILPGSSVSHTGRSFDLVLGPIPTGLGGSGEVRVQLTDADVAPLGLIAKKIALTAPGPSPSPEGPTGLTEEAAVARAAIQDAAARSDYEA